MTSLFDRYLEGTGFVKNPTPELSRSQLCVKRVLIVTNAVFLIFACVLMGVGSVAYNHNVGPLTGATIPVGIIVSGVFIMFLSFVGCFGAWRESRICLGCYFSFLFVFTIILLAVGIGVDNQRSEASWYIQQGWMDSNNGVRVSFQNAYGCCGLNTWNDTLAGQPCPSNPVPKFNTTCLSLLVTSFNNSFTTLGGVGVSFAVLMLVGMTIVCCLMRGIRRKAKVLGPNDSDTIHTGEDSAAPSVEPQP